MPFSYSRMGLGEFCLGRLFGIGSMGGIVSEDRGHLVLFQLCFSCNSLDFWLRNIALPVENDDGGRDLGNVGAVGAKRGDSSTSLEHVV